jgi:hypothetical protein
MANFPMCNQDSSSLKKEQSQAIRKVPGLPFLKRRKILNSEFKQLYQKTSPF